jgi:hypothetical protein
MPTMMHEFRLHAMLANDGVGRWDLNDEDRAAIAWALAKIEGKRAAEPPQAATLLEACRATLLFHADGPWDEAKQGEWFNITQHPEATSRILCDTVRAAIARAEKGGTP